MNIYCVYLTIYYGHKLPMFYIGSSTIKKVENGYRGSVQSKKYEVIWKQELKQNPWLFKTKIVSVHDSDEMARNKELSLQKQLNVVKSPMYINESYAQVNGYFGRILKGKNSPRYEVKHTDETKKKISDKHHCVIGSNNPRARRIQAISPSGEVFHIYGELKKWCKEQGLGYSTVHIILSTNKTFVGSTNGWKFNYLD